MAYAWISRAGTFKVSVRCHADARSRVPMRLNLNPVQDIIDPFAHRLRSIELSVPLLLMSPFSWMFDGALSEIESLDLFCLDDEDALGIESFPVFRTMPGLKRLRLDPRSDNFKILDVGVQWSKLTHLSVGWLMEVGDYLPILSTCINLEECKLEIALLRGVSSESEDPVVTLPHLHTLTLSVCDFGDLHLGHAADYLLDHLLTPSLHSFTILPDLRGAHLSWPHDPFMSFCTRSNILTKLHTLNITIDDIISNMHIRHIARSLPSLTHVALEGHSSVDNETFLLLSEDGILPALASLELIIQGDAPSAQAFKTFLTARLRKGVLKSVVLGHRKQSFRHTFQRWKTEGFLKDESIHIERRNILES